MLYNIMVILVFIVVCLAITGLIYSLMYIDLEDSIKYPEVTTDTLPVSHNSTSEGIKIPATWVTGKIVPSERWFGDTYKHIPLIPKKGAAKRIAKKREKLREETLKVVKLALKQKNKSKRKVRK